MFQFLIPAAAALIGGAMSSRSAKQAAQTQASAQDRATALQERIYEENIARQQPFLETGTEFFNKLAALQRGGPEAQMNFLQMDPGYGFRLGEGMKALERSAAARGGLLSGATMKGLQRYGQDLASQEYGQAYNRLANLANVGPRAAGIAADIGQNYANQMGNLYMQGGVNQGNAMLARGSAYQRGLGDVASLAGRYYGGGGGTQPGAPISEATPYNPYTYPGVGE